MIKLIVFDWDDVFTLGSKEGYFKCYHEALKGVGVHLEPEEEKKRILAKWSKPHKEELKELLKEHPELVNKACKIYEEKFFSGIYVDHLSLVEGSRELLERLSKKYILAIATGANPHVLKDEVFPKFSIPDVFSQILYTYNIDDPEMHKPHPYMLTKIMNKQKAHQRETIFVGDAKTDVQMAQAANVTPVVVLTGHLNKKEAEELGVKYVIGDVTQIEKVLAQVG
ncbi:MAG TPA: HAD family hydrolase [Xanthomonadales bacterium]|nr:HAD family hydrolase [Xanthomonadales bacterium]